MFIINTQNIAGFGGDQGWMDCILFKLNNASLSEMGVDPVKVYINK